MRFASSFSSWLSIVLVLFITGAKATSVDKAQGFVETSVKVGTGFQAETQAYNAGLLALKVKGAALLATHVTREYVSEPKKLKEVIKINTLSVVKLNRIQSSLEDGVLRVSAIVELDDAEVLAKLKRRRLLSEIKQKLEEFNTLKNIVEKGEDSINWLSMANSLTEGARYEVDMEYLESKSNVTQITNQAKIEALKERVEDTNSKIFAFVNEVPLFTIAEVDLCSNDYGRRTIHKHNSVDQFLAKWFSYYSDKSNPDVNKNVTVVNHPMAVDSFKCIDITLDINLDNMTKVANFIRNLQYQESLFFKKLKLDAGYELTDELVPYRKVTIHSLLVFKALAELKNKEDLSRVYVEYRGVERTLVSGYFSFISFHFEDNEFTYSVQNSHSSDECIDNGVYFEAKAPNCYRGQRLLPIFAYTRATDKQRASFRTRVFYDSFSMMIESIDGDYFQ